MNKVHFKAQVIPAHTISDCWDCKYYSGIGGVELCTHDLAPDSDVTGDGIPDWCPELIGQEQVSYTDIAV